VGGGEGETRRQELLGEQASNVRGGSARDQSGRGKFREVPQKTET